jgi:uncharacterized protein (TIGR02596 family)
MKTRQKGFSLVEILVIIAIIGFLLVLSMPTLRGVFKTSKLGQGADQFRNHMSVAHIEAIKNSVPVEVRIYKYDDPRLPDSTEYYTAYQMFLRRPNQDNPGDPNAEPYLEPFGELYQLPQGVIIVDDEKLSTLVGQNVRRGSAKIRGLEGSTTETSVQYAAFEIRPDGSMNLPEERNLWYLTFMPIQAILAGETSEPKNYVCIQWDPTNTNSNWFQPK